MLNIPEKLRELREQSGLSQQDVAELAGIGVKSLSSFECGARISSMKVEQLEAICGVYGITLAEFFVNSPDEFTTTPSQNAFFDLLSDVFTKPEHVQQALLSAFRAVIHATAPEVRRVPADPLVSVRIMRPEERSVAA